MALRRIPAGATLLDDTYNANAASMLAALDTLARLPVEGRRIAVLGDMLELGDEAARDHHRVGRAAAAADILIAIGQDAAGLAQGAREAGMPGERIVLLSATLDDADSSTPPANPSSTTSATTSNPPTPSSSKPATESASAPSPTPYLSPSHHQPTPRSTCHSPRPPPASCARVFLPLLTKTSAQLP